MFTYWTPHVYEKCYYEDYDLPLQEVMNITYKALRYKN